MASIHQLESQRWQVRWREPSGRQRKQTFLRKHDASRFKRDLEHAVDVGLYLDPRAGRVLLGDWALDWLSTQAHLKPKTLDSYMSLLTVHVLPAFANAWNFQHCS